MIYRIPLVAVLSSTLVFAPPLFAQDELPLQTLFTNVHVWDGTSDGITKRINVLVEGNVIEKLRADTSNAHSDAVVIDAPGMVLMPGLINSHTHLNLTGLFYTYAGGQSAQWCRAQKLYRDIIQQ